MSIELLLSKLEKVKRTGRDSWAARCPAREDRTPSMTIRLLDDGRILLHDFGGSSVDSILGAVGLTFDDLYPEREADPYKPNKPERMPFNPRDVLAAIATESLIVGIAGVQIGNGEPLQDDDRERLLLAVSRVQEAARMCHAD